MIHLVAIVLIFVVSFVPKASADMEGLKTYKDLLEETNRRIRNIDTDSLKRLLEENPNIVLLDVRLPGEVESMGHIDAKQQVNIPRGWVEVQIVNHVIDKNTPIVAYCGAGIRSAFVVDALRNMGFTDVQNYAEGFLGWQERGLPIVR